MRPAPPAIAALLLFTFLSSGCGLGMSTEDRVLRAGEALEAGEHRAAIIDAKNVLLEAPDNLEARLILGRASLAAGDGAAAEKELRRAVELGAPYGDVATDLARSMLLKGEYAAIVAEFEPGTPRDEDDRRALLLVLGEARLALHEPATAREHFTRALESHPDDRAAQLGVASTYIAERNLLQARETVNHVLDANPGYGRAWLTSARLHMIAGDPDAAVADYERARQQADEERDIALRTEAVHGIADASLVMAKHDQAREYADMLDALAPNTVAALQIAGRLAYADGDWSLAQEKLTEVLRRAPRNDLARTMLGAVHLKLDNPGQAEMYLSAAVANDPQNADARRLLAEAQLKLNKSEQAELALRPLVDSASADPRSLAMAARVDLLSGDFEGAARYLERSAAEQPETAAVQLDLAVAYLLAGRIDEAQRILDNAPGDDSANSAFRREVLRVLAASRADGVEAALPAGAALRDSWPDRVMAHVLHGGMLMSIGDAAGAREAFGAARGVDAGDATPLRYLARADEAEGHRDAARQRYREILDLDPADVHALFSLGRLAVEDEDVASAIDWLEQARAAGPRAVAPRFVLGRLYLAEGRYDDAEAALGEALELSDGTAELHGTMGLVQLAKEQAGAAAEHLSRALELDPGNRDHRLNLARARAAAGDAEQVVAILEGGEASPLRHLPSGLLLANAQVAAGDADAALRTARELRRRHADSGVPIAFEAELLARRGEVRRAIALYDEALEVETTRTIAVRAYNVRRNADDVEAERPLLRFLEKKPSNTEVRVLLAQHYHQHDAIDEAITQYRRVLDARPDDFVSLNNLAWLYFVADDGRAEATARRAHAQAPNNASVIDTLGWILVKKNKIAEGLVFLREAVELSDGPEVRYHLAAGLAASGDQDGARRLLEDILAAESDFPSRDEARTLLASL